MKNREIIIEFAGRSYKISYPNVGQFIDIATRESTLSKGNFKDLILSGLPDHQEAFGMIKVIAFIEIMLPQLVKDLKTESLLDLDPVDFEQISIAYFDIILPWLTEWRTKIQEAPKVDVM